MTNKAYPVSQAVASAALTMIPADDRDVWVRMGMALKSEFGEDGYQMFHDWSEGGAGFDAKVALSTWKSFKTGGRITIGSLIAEAKRHGFNPKDHAAAVPLSAEERDKARRERVARDKAAEQAMQQGQASAAAQARIDWDAASAEGTAPYLVKKGVHAHGVRFEGGKVVLVPLRDEAGKLWNVQRIYPDGNKLFPAGGRVSGCFHVIGETQGAKLLLVAEGYATAATLHQATGLPVVICFNEVNVRNVAKVLPTFAPGARFLFCADDDQETEEKKGKNPGLASAQTAAASVGGQWCKPEGLPKGGSDFNDLAHAAGMETVRAQLAAACERALVGEALPTEGVTTSGVVGKTPVAAAVAASVAATGTAQNKGRTRPRKADSGTDSATAGQASRPFFNVDERGVWYHGFSNQGDPLPAQWICSEMHVTAQSRDAGNGEWGYLLEFEDGDGNAKRWAMPASMLAGDGTQYRAVLLSMGLRIGAGTAAKEALIYS